MGADDQNVKAGIMGTGSGKPPASRSAVPPGAAAGPADVPGAMRAVVLDAPGPPSALAICELPPQVLQDFLDAVAVGTAAVPIGRVYRFDQIVEAHTDMEQNRASGKLVVTT